MGKLLFLGTFSHYCGNVKAQTGSMSAKSTNVKNRAQPCLLWITDICEAFLLPQNDVVDPPRGNNR